MPKPNTKRQHRKNAEPDPAPLDRFDEPEPQPRSSAEPSDAGGDEGGEVALPAEAIEIIQALETERDQARAARIRALADYDNYRKRAAEEEVRAKSRGAAEVAKSIVPVLDNFERALSQDVRQVGLEPFAQGVRLLRDELFKALESHGVSVILPEVGEEFDPTRHEAMFRQSVEGIGPNCITAVLQNGYAMGSLVLRPAKVAVSASQT